MVDGVKSEKTADKGREGSMSFVTSRKEHAITPDMNPWV